MTRVRKTFLPNEMTTQGSISQPVLVTVHDREPTGTMAIANTRTVAELREITRALNLQHYDTQNVILRVEMVSTTTGLPRPSEFAFLLFCFLSGDGSWRV